MVNILYDGTTARNPRGEADMRLLAAVRLSRLSDSTTSVDTQAENLEEYARRHGHTIVALTEDLDVSGGKPIRERPGVGPWFKRLDEWDGLLGYSIDRMFRNHYDFVTTWHDVFEPNGKKLIAVSEDIDMTTEAGELSAHMRVLFAQAELRKMRERNSRKAKKLITSGYANGGRSSMHWGYMTQKHGDHSILVPDPDVVPVVRQAVDDILAGTSARQIALRVSTDPSTLVRRLRSPELKGWVMYKGEPVRGIDGLPMLREPIIGEAKWDRLQARLDAKASGTGVPKDATPWLHVIYCQPCGRELYLARCQYDGRLRKYYRHKDASKCRTHVNGFRLEAQIEPLILRAFDGMYIPEVVREPAVSHADELARIEQSIRDLEDKFVTSGGDVGRLARLTSDLAARAHALRAEEHPARTDIKMTDELFTDRWASLTTDAERGALLRKMGVRLYATPTGNSDAKLALRQIRNGDTRHWTEIVSEWTDADIEQFEAEETG
jgi:DNA invertase Pin-like site-specific DNA recombinase